MIEGNNELVFFLDSSKVRISMEAFHRCWSRRDWCWLPWSSWSHPLQSLWHWFHHPCRRSHCTANPWAHCHPTSLGSGGLGCNYSWWRRLRVHWHCGIGCRKSMKEDFVTQAPSISTAADICFLSLNCMCLEIDKNIYEAWGQLDVLNSLPSGETGIWEWKKLHNFHGPIFVKITWGRRKQAILTTKKSQVFCPSSYLIPEIYIQSTWDTTGNMMRIKSPNYQKPERS